MLGRRLESARYIILHQASESASGRAIGSCPSADPAVFNSRCAVHRGLR